VRLYNRYILTVAILLLLTTVIMIAMGQDSLGIYYMAYIIEAFIVTELFVFFNRKARRGLTYVSVMLFGGFAILLVAQVFKILL